MPIYDAINFTDAFLETGATASVTQTINATAANARVSLLLCPADPAAVCGVGDNYRVRVHAGATLMGGRPGLRGLFNPSGPLRPASMLDGLSHTAAMSEKPRSDSGGEVFTAYAEYIFASELANG